MANDTSKQSRNRDLWTVNGKTAAGWRIDRVAEDNVGLAMLMNPVAVCPDRAFAEQIVAEHNLLINAAVTSDEAADEAERREEASRG